MSAYLTEIINLLVGGITGVATGIGTGVASLVNALFIDSSGTTPTLSAFMSVVAIFAGIALAVGLCVRIFTWLQSLGGSK